MKINQAITQYLVTIETPAGVYEIEVPSTQGSEAAGRRAIFAIASAYERTTDLDRIKVLDTEIIEPIDCEAT